MKIPMPLLFAMLTALCWGLYGPVLGKARLADPDHSPFKPYVGIGIAYLVLAILGGLMGMWYKADSFKFTGTAGLGILWGVAAGSLGALGALNLTLSMFSGGARIPHLVMPVVFGGAVTVTAIYSVVATGAQGKFNPWLWVGIVGMGLCIVLVAYNTPHGGPSPPKTEAAQTTSVQEAAVEQAEPSG